MNYWAPTKTTIVEYEIKRSRFIAQACRCSDVATFKSFLEKIKTQHPKASHHCYAFTLGNPLDSRLHGASDDGEPSGTAGQPMLKALTGYQHDNASLGETGIIVTRYFGGIKLGTGGLARAYTQGIKESLTPMTFELVYPTNAIWLEGPYDKEDKVQRQLLAEDIQITERQYGEQVRLQAQIPLHINDEHLAELLPYPWKKCT